MLNSLNIRCWYPVRLPYLQRSMIVARTVATFLGWYARGSRWLARFHADISAWIITREKSAASRWNAFHLYTSTGSGFMAISACKPLISRATSPFSIRFRSGLSLLPVTVGEAAHPWRPATPSRRFWDPLAFLCFVLITEKTAMLSTDRGQVHRVAKRWHFH